MNNFVLPKTIIGLLAITVTSLAVILFVSFLDDDKSIVSAQVVDVDEPPTNATEELDVKIDATEPLPANGTIIVDISDADDIDIDAIPPEGVSIVVTNTTLTVTNNPVKISEASGTSPADTEGAGTQASTGDNENEAGESSDSDGGDGGEGSVGESDTPDEEE